MARKANPEKKAHAKFVESALRVEDIIAINLPPDVRRRRTVSQAGKVKSKYTLQIETEPVLHDLREEHLGRGPAEKIAELAGANLRNAGKRAAQATLKWRKNALERYRSGGAKAKRRDRSARENYILKRYSGGNIGKTPPDPDSHKYGVDSGRLADNFFARIAPRAKEWIINVPANRLNRDEWTGDDASFRHWLGEFRRIVNISAIVGSMEFEKELYKSLKGAIGLLKAKQWQKRRDLLRQQWKVIKGGARLMAVI